MAAMDLFASAYVRNGTLRMRTVGSPGVTSTPKKCAQPIHSPVSP